MKKVTNIVGALTIAAALTAGFSACTNEDIIVNEQQQPTVQATLYHVSIPATMESEAETRAVEFGNDGKSITSTFETTENVYVYNETQDAFACDANGNPIALHPSNLSANRKNCTLTGDLTFYKYSYYTNGYNPVNIGATDTYSLFYQMNDVDTQNSEYATFTYNNQAGTAADASAHDFAKATGVTMTVVGNTLTVNNATVNFQLLQSMFRQHLTFVDENGDEISPAPTISRLVMSSKNWTLVDYINPVYDYTDHLYLNINGLDGSDLYVALTFDYSQNSADNDKIVIEAYDENGNKYYGSKNAPSSGFQNGKYYYGSMVMTYAPVMCTDNDTPVKKNNEGKYILEDGHNYTASGLVNGNIEGSGQITLTLEGGTVINGYVILQSIFEGYKFANIYVQGNSTINYPVNSEHPDAIALQAQYNFATTISGEYTTLTVNGNVSHDFDIEHEGMTLVINGNIIDGTYQLGEKTYLKVSGNTGGVAGIIAAFDGDGNSWVNIENNPTEYDGTYKVFYGGEYVDQTDPGDPYDPNNPDPGMEP